MLHAASLRSWFLAIVGVALLLGYLPAARAVEPPASETSALRRELQFVPPEAFAAVLAFPQRALSAPGAKLSADKVASSIPLTALGLDPRQIERVLALVLPPSGSGLDAGFVVCFEKPYSREALFPRVLPAQPNAEVAGHAYYRPADPWPSLFLADDRTVVLGTEKMLRAMLSANDASSELLTMLRAADTTSDLRALVVVEPVRELLTARLARRRQAPAVAILEKAPELLATVELGMPFWEPDRFSLVLNGRDEAAGAEVEQMVQQLIALLRKVSSDAISQAADKAPNDGVRQIVEKLAGKAREEMFAEYLPERDKGQVTVSAKIESGLARFLLPETDQTARKPAADSK